MRLNNIDEAIQYALAQRIGNTSDVHIINETIVSIWLEFAQQLEPVIGVQGTEVLYIRALHLIHKRFPWIVIADKSNNTILIREFLNSFEGSDTSLIIKASHALLLTFSQLLGTLIGEDLTSRLLNPVLLQPSKSENKHE